MFVWFCKPNNKSPNDLAQILIELFKNEDKNIEEISLQNLGLLILNLIKIIGIILLIN